MERRSLGPRVDFDGFSQLGWAAFVVSLKRMLEVGEAWHRVEDLHAISA